MQRLINSVEEKLSYYLDEDVKCKVMQDIRDSLMYYNVDRITTEVSTTVDITMETINRYELMRKAEGISNGTIYNESKFLKKFFLCVRKSFTEITPFDITIYAYQLTQNGMKQNSLQNFYKSLNGFYGWLKKLKAVHENPMDNVNKIKDSHIYKKALSSVELEKLKDFAGIRELAIIEFLCSTGARINEAINVKISDINFEQKECVLRVTKNDKPRTVYLNDISILRIKEYLSTRRGNSEYLFCKGRSPYSQLTPDGFRYTLNSIAKMAGVEDVYPHRFRRTFCTNALNRGMPIQEVSKIMGHSSISTTMRYVDIDNSQLKNSFNFHLN